MRYYYTPIRRVKTEKFDHPKHWREHGGTATTTHPWWERKTVQLLWKTAGYFLKKLNIHLQYDPVIPFLDICPREMKAYVHTKKPVQECV